MGKIFVPECNEHFYFLLTGNPEKIQRTSIPVEVGEGFPIGSLFKRFNRDEPVRSVSFLGSSLFLLRKTVKGISPGNENSSVSELHSL
jgi:hypothetical protein